MYIRAGTRLKWQARINTAFKWSGDVHDLKAELERMGWREVAVNRYGTLFETLIIQATAPIDFNDISDIRGLFTGVAQKYFWVSTGSDENQIWIDGAPATPGSGVESLQGGVVKQGGAAVEAVKEGASNNFGLIIVAAIVAMLYIRNRG